MTTDYKKLVCQLIAEGYVTLEEVKAVGEKIKPVGKVKEGPSWDSAKLLMSELKQLIIANGHKPFSETQENLASLEKLIRIDKHTEAEVREVMFFAMSDDFWSSVILSPANLRKHYEKIVAKQVRLGKVKPPVVVVSPPATEFLDKMAKATEESKPMPKGFKEALKKGKK